MESIFGRPLETCESILLSPSIARAAQQRVEPRELEVKRWGLLHDWTNGVKELESD